jgi:predicted RNase H-like HicB family nuclease
MDKKYEIIIFWSSEDNAYVAEVPELAGCMADGKTYREALGNAEQIVLIPSYGIYKILNH